MIAVLFKAPAGRGAIDLSARHRSARKPPCSTIGTPGKFRSAVFPGRNAGASLKRVKGER